MQSADLLETVCYNLNDRLKSPGDVQIVTGEKDSIQSAVLFESPLQQGEMRSLLPKLPASLS